VEELNIKRKSWKDLIDDTPFKKEDIVTIQARESLLVTAHGIPRILRIWKRRTWLARGTSNRALQKVCALFFRGSPYFSSEDELADPRKRIRADPTSKRVFEQMAKKEKEEEERKAKLKAEGIVEAPAVRRCDIMKLSNVVILCAGSRRR
jgi:hypothetical protein